ncbi:hypothetical protein FHL15_006871 [Xylaria flabelliformis]|uniref:Uncharacterized protein n=1 Tax=Xylaria flabelliformis TaxID=2512241 RepID=A0A553HWC1_9PEZI|nr:hypothetical protein FHL15_006871 [Xylaria flabelliformis]
MSDSRRVKFSSSPPLRGVLKHSEPNPRDSGVGSSSSDHTGSSGSLDERFTVRDYNVQSNNVDALREALTDAIKDIDHWKNKYQKKNNEQTETRRKHRDTDALYRDAIERNQTMQAKVDSMGDRMEKQDVALDIANTRISDLQAELADWKEKYQILDDLYESVRHSANTSIVSGGSGDHSMGLSAPRSHRDRKESEDMASRMKERINRENPDSGSSHASRSSRSSEATVSSKRTGHRTSVSASDNKPYIEKMPRASANSLASPRQHGTYSLTTAEKASASSSSSRRHGTGSSRTGNREHGDYIAHPLPDRSRRIS